MLLVLLLSITDTSANDGIPATVTNTTAGLYLVHPPATSCIGIYLTSLSTSQSPPVFRIYCSQITLQPSMAGECILNNRAKKCIYRTVF